jgi:hypothetical protein
MTDLIDGGLAAWLDSLPTDADIRRAVCDSAMQIVREEWHQAVKKFNLSPGSPTEEVTGRILGRIAALNIQQRASG